MFHEISGALEVITDQYSTLQPDWELALEAHKWTAVEKCISRLV